MACQAKWPWGKPLACLPPCDFMYYWSVSGSFWAGTTLAFPSKAMAWGLVTLIGLSGSSWKDPLACSMTSWALDIPSRAAIIYSGWEIGTGWGYAGCSPFNTSIYWFTLSVWEPPIYFAFYFNALAWSASKNVLKVSTSSSLPALFNSSTTVLIK